MVLRLEQQGGLSRRGVLSFVFVDHGFRVYDAGDEQKSNVSRDTILGVLEDTYQDVIQRFGLGPNDRVQLLFEQDGRYVSTPWDRVSLITPSMLLDVLTNESSTFVLELAFVTFYIKISKAPRVGNEELLERFHQFCRSKQIVIEVEGIEDTCLMQCLAIGVAYYDNMPLFSRLSRKHPQLPMWRLEAAFDIDPQAGGPMSLQQLQVYERKFNLRLYVFDVLTLSWVYTPLQEEGRLLYLVYSKEAGHVNLVHPGKHDRLGTLYNKRRFCRQCQKGYRPQDRHRCLSKCVNCDSTECIGSSNPLTPTPVECSKCNLSFIDAQCFAEHKVLRTCQRRERCMECLEIYRPNRYDKHECYHHKCAVCKDMVPDDEEHLCFHQEEDLKEPDDKYIFYDYEAFIDANGTHTVAGIVAMTYHDDTPIRFRTTETFVNWLTLSKHKDYTVIAHNSGRYDHHYLMDYFIQRRWKTRDIVNGNSYIHAKLVQKGLPELTFIDSYKFIPIPLRKFSKTFGLTATKGYFPYRFFTPEREAYIGPWPGVQWFDFDRLPGDEREQATQWLQRQNEKVISLYEECMKYCEDDVALLRKGCLSFRQLFLNITNGEIDPFQYYTIASVCMKLYKYFFLPANTIGHIVEDTTDQDKLDWLSTLPAGLELNKQIGNVVVDAFDGETAYCFFACADIGCWMCYRSHTTHPKTHVPMFRLRKAYKNKISDLKRLVNVQVMKTCNWLLHKLDNQVPVTEIGSFNLRDAFFGGRTEPFKLYARGKIGYFDYTSLYPSIQFGRVRGITAETQDEWVEFEYPVGHPTMIKTDFDYSLESYFGIVKCRVLPPAGLYLPLLPNKSSGKLIFDLKERIGTWTTVELRKALELGYKILEIFHVAHFEQRSKDLFSDYVRLFLKIKQEAAGWVKLGCSTDEEKKTYIDDYYQTMGIQLDANKIGDYNPGLYYISKLCLNSQWGKYGQRTGFANTATVFDEKAFLRLAHNDRLEVFDVLFHDDISRTISYRVRNEFLTLGKSSNVVICAFTTAYARLRLYQAMEVLGEDLLYTDTDSVIFIDRGQLVTGPYLGDLTSELEDGEWIEEFVTAGPKSYAYRTNKGTTVCKVKGFTLDGRAREVLNFESMKELVLRNKDKTLAVKQLYFEIHNNHKISSGDVEKTFRLTFDKRKVLKQQGGMIDTVPLQ
jgi:hypothetical protein